MRDAARCVLLVLSAWVTGCGLTTGSVRSAPTTTVTVEESPPPGSGPPASGAAAASGPQMRTISGEVTAVSNDVAGLVAAVRAHTGEVGGSVAREDVSGDAQHRQASLELRLPPPAVSAFIDWLGGRAAIETRHLEDDDVSRQSFDRDVAIRNLEVTLERLRELTRQPDGKLADVLEVERELTRVRGELEKLRGEQRVLVDRVARATLAITLTMNPDVHAEPALKFELLPHLTALHLVDAGPRQADRIGGGVTLMASRAGSVDFEVLAPRGGDPRSYLLTIATGVYSDFLGGGRRRFGNPYVGIRLGGAKMNGLGAFAYGVDAGVELVRFKLFLVEVTGRAVGLWYNRDNAPKNDLLLEGTIGVGVPF
jgi:hypothetical protein